MYMCRQLQRAMERFSPTVNDRTLPWGMLHADIFPDNTLYDPEKDRLAVIDWEVRAWADSLWRVPVPYLDFHSAGNML